MGVSTYGPRGRKPSQVFDVEILALKKFFAVVFTWAKILGYHPGDAREEDHPRGVTDSLLGLSRCRGMIPEVSTGFCFPIEAGVSAGSDMFDTCQARSGMSSRRGRCFPP